jgi:hypothetical protein
MRGNSEHSLKEAIQLLVKSYKIEGKLNEVKLLGSWARLMGPMIAHRTGDISIRDKKLFVKLTSAPLREELNMARPKIISLLNAEAGAEVIEEIIFQ